MASKVYTAQEIREAAIVADTVEVADQFYGQEMDKIAAMLRQAADALEREAKREKKYEYSVRYFDRCEKKDVVDDLHMPNERNALAELAHTLCGVFIDNRCYATVGKCIDAMNAIKKAQRIIAELAKVKPVYNVYTNEPCWPTAGQACDALMTCRAIAAEEGAKE